MKTGWGIAVVALVALGVGACSSSGGSSSTVQQVMCFARATSSEGYGTLNIQVLGASDCTNIANAVSNGNLSTVGGYTAKANTGSATGHEVCSGVIGDYPVNVYSSNGDTGVCTYLGLPVVP